MAKYDYTDPAFIEEVSDVRSAIRTSVFSYCKAQLGWSERKCKERIDKEIKREIPKGLFDTQEERWGWELSGAKILDVGSGQGGAVLEALLRGADAYGIEPGDEFVELSRLRLEEADFEQGRIRRTGGESIPFDNNTFDYVVSLQVLEHVEDPYPILEEIFRVLIPGGKAHIRCENYLAFREQHYRVPWLPMLPKSIGSFYLRALGRDPSFLKDYVFYSTYPKIIQMVEAIGFQNEKIEKRRQKLDRKESIERKSAKAIAHILNCLPNRFRERVTDFLLHMTNVFRTGIRLQLKKPK